MSIKVVKLIYYRAFCWVQQYGLVGVPYLHLLKINYNTPEIVKINKDR